MKNSITKRLISALLILGMTISSAQVVLADGTVEPISDEQTAIQEVETDGKKQDAITLANDLANGTHIYYPEANRNDVIIENKTMSLKYGVLADSNEMYVKNFSNTKGQAYIENTFDVYMKNGAGDKFYASSSIYGGNVNVYRYGYYYYENRIEGQSFITDMTYDSYYNVNLSTPTAKSSISEYVTDENGSAYFITSTPANDVFFGYTTMDGNGNYLSTEDYDFVEIKMKLENAGTSSQVFIVAGDENREGYNSEQSLDFNAINDGEYHVYRIPISNISNYSDMLKCVRFDVDSKSGSRVDIEYIRLFKADYVGMDTGVTIQRSFLSYSDKLHHLTQVSTLKEITDVSEVGIETKIDANTVNGLVIKDKNGRIYTLDGVDWASAEYVGFDIEGAGIFGYILPCDNNSGSITVTLENGYYILTQSLPLTSLTPSVKGQLNKNDVFFGQRIYNDESHDFTAFIAEAECERHPLTKDNILIDYSEDGTTAFQGYDPLYGFYKFAIGGVSFNPAYYTHPNRHYNVRFTVKGDDRDRKMYVMTRCTGTGGLESAVLLDENNMLLPIPMEVAKNFSGDGENTVYNLDDAQYAETFFPIPVNAGEKYTYNVLNLYQNWGRFPLKQISSIQFHTPYYHLSTGVTETNCITLFGVPGPGLPDHRAMSAPHWETQPQHNSGGAHSFLRYTDSEGNFNYSQNTTASIDSYGPTYCDITLGFVSDDGRVTAEYTHTEMPQLDENRAYYEMKYTFKEDITFKNFAQDFTFYRVSSNNSTGTYKKVGYLNEDNECTVVDSVKKLQEDGTNVTEKMYTLGDRCPYFSFFMMPDWNRSSTSAEGYTNLSMLFKDWTITRKNGEKVTAPLCIRNQNEFIYLSMVLEENFTFHEGDTITINAILMPWGSQEMEENEANRLNKDHVADYSATCPRYTDVIGETADGQPVYYMDKNVRDVRENTLLNPLIATEIENCETITTPFVPKLRTTNGQSATFKLSGGTDNNAVRVYGFNKLTVPKIEQLVDGNWVEYEVSSKNTPDASGYANDYDGYMVHYDADGTYSYSFVFNMTDVKERTFRITAENDFGGWGYTPSETTKEGLNVTIDAKTIRTKAEAATSYFTGATLSDDESYVKLDIVPGVGESYSHLYSGSVNKPTGQYVVYKYRIPTTNKSGTGSVEFWTSTSRTGANADGIDVITINNSALQSDGKWHVMVVDVLKLKKAECTFEPNDHGAYCARYLRVDFTGAKLTAGDYIDVAYVGFSDNISEIIAANGDVDSIDLVNADKTTFTSISTKDYAPADDTAKVSIESASIHKDKKELSLKLRIENNKGLSFLRVIPKYDSSILTLTKVENGELLSNMSQFEGSFVWNDTVNTTEDGTVATFTFEFKDGVDFGSYAIELILVDAFGKSLASPEFIAIDAVANIIEHEYGDSTGDGAINAFDIVALRSFLATLDTESGSSSQQVSDGADVNGDGFVDAIDLLEIRKYIAGYDYTNDKPTYIIGRQE